MTLQFLCRHPAQEKKVFSAECCSRSADLWRVLDGKRVYLVLFHVWSGISWLWVHFRVNSNLIMYSCTRKGKWLYCTNRNISTKWGQDSRISREVSTGRLLVPHLSTVRGALYLVESRRLLVEREYHICLLYEGLSRESRRVRGVYRA